MLCIINYILIGGSETGWFTPPPVRARRTRSGHATQIRHLGTRIEIAGSVAIKINSFK